MLHYAHFILTISITTLFTTDTRALDYNPSDAASVHRAGRLVAPFAASAYSSPPPSTTTAQLPRPQATNLNSQFVYPQLTVAPTFTHDALFTSSIFSYAAYSGDFSWTDLATDALIANIGQASDYRPMNISSIETWEQQSAWALAALDAYTHNLTTTTLLTPVTTTNTNATWLALANVVFHQQTEAWDTTTCGGGLRGSINEPLLPNSKATSSMASYADKTSDAAAGLMLLAARMQLATGNASYGAWADSVYTWLGEVGLLNTTTGAMAYKIPIITCGTQAQREQIQPDRLELRLATTVAYACAIMWNLTSSPQWRTRTNLHLATLYPPYPTTNLTSPTPGAFFEPVNRSDCSSLPPPGDILAPPSTFCYHFFDAPNTAPAADVTLAQATLNLARTALLAPFSAPFLGPKLRASSVAAASMCHDPADANATDGGCTQNWAKQQSGGARDLGAQLAALNAFTSQLMTSSKPLELVDTASYVQVRPGQPNTQGRIGSANGDGGAGESSLLDRPRLPPANDAVVCRGGRARTSALALALGFLAWYGM